MSKMVTLRLTSAHRFNLGKTSLDLELSQDESGRGLSESPSAAEPYVIRFMAVLKPLISDT